MGVALQRSWGQWEGARLEEMLMATNTTCACNMKDTKNEVLIPSHSKKANNPAMHFGSQ